MQREHTALLSTLIERAEALKPGEALQIGGDTYIIARSKSGTLRLGGGGCGAFWTRWWRGDFHEMLTEVWDARTDWTKVGHDAQKFRREVEWALSRPAIRVEGVGRTTVRYVGEGSPSDA